VQEQLLHIMHTFDRTGLKAILVGAYLDMLICCLVFPCTQLPLIKLSDTVQA
jgi:hypothetical protein